MARKKKFNGIKYMFTNDSEDAVYRFDVENGEVGAIYEKCGKDTERLITHPELVNDAMHCYLRGYPITKEQYDSYDSALGLIACGLIENHTHGTHYDDAYYAKERAKGVKHGYLKSV